MNTESLLKPSRKEKHEAVRIKLKESLLNEVNGYKDWAGFDRVDDVIESALLHVLSKDKAWKATKESA